MRKRLESDEELTARPGSALPRVERLHGESRGDGVDMRREHAIAAAEGEATVEAGGFARHLELGDGIRLSSAACWVALSDAGSQELSADVGTHEGRRDLPQMTLHRGNAGRMGGPAFRTIGNR